MSDDPQRDLLYRFEDSFRSFGERTATRDEIRCLIRRACRLYNTPLPTIAFRNKIESAKLRIISDYDPSTHTITIGWTDCNHAVAVHEAAHAIMDEQFEDDADVQDHGPEFMAIYLRLLEWAQVAPRSALRASAKAFGLEWGKSTS